MSLIREEMPVLVRHEGDWLGTYTVVDVEGKIIDKHESHLTCQFPDDDAYSYYQINRYKWANGKQEEHQFPGTYRDKALWFNTERIDGKAWEIDNATIILWFSYKTAPGMYLYEMINLSPCNNYRSRTWHWFKDHQLFQRTLIQEERLR
ncbi:MULTISPECIES: DUF3598 family protein [Nostocales]|uniref:DUF3598 domain-containing protein n=3 Tax=Nostocales TaxID=1161 RepID=A0A0C1NGT1_9CYAN|nr:DUF3598 family protein [Tolypothrix bouteillei]KAF3890685.1 DUF3598 domain-containing protein [Tolypothrix bouteillei VB521301]